MRLNLHPVRLADRLAAGEVTPREQATYLILGSVMWLVLSYSGIWRTPVSTDEPFATALRAGEFAMLAVVNVVGMLHCLRQCRREPARHFAVDFCCLFTPVGIWVLAATWAAFHLVAWLLPSVVDRLMTESSFRSTSYVLFRVHDFALYLTVVGQLALIYWIVGRLMGRASERRA